MLLHVAAHIFWEVLLQRNILIVNVIRERTNTYLLTYLLHGVESFLRN